MKTLNKKEFIENKTLEFEELLTTSIENGDYGNLSTFVEQSLNESFVGGYSQGVYDGITSTQEDIRIRVNEKIDELLK